MSRTWLWSKKVSVDFCSDENGASAVEFSIVSSVFIALCLVIIQLGWTLQIRNHLAEAADTAIRTILVDPEASDSTIEAQVESALANYNADDLDVEAGETTVDGTDFRTLNIQYDLALAVPYFPSGLISLSVNRRVPVWDD